MKKISKRVLLCVFLVVGMLMMAACSQLDVIGNGSVSSFEKVLIAIPDKVETVAGRDAWAIVSPDGSARYVWSADFSKSQMFDVLLELDAKPFLDAGLDASKLPESMAFYGDTITVGSKLGDTAWTYDGEKTALTAYAQIVSRHRDLIGYHAAMDHYGIRIGDGNMFEWAKDMSNNDKDAVFVLNPDPFIAAGVDPAQIEGWAFAKVDTMDSSGKMISVDKLLKPFNIR